MLVDCVTRFSVVLVRGPWKDLSRWLDSRQAVKESNILER